MQYTDAYRTQLQTQKQPQEQNPCGCIVFIFILFFSFLAFQNGKEKKDDLRGKGTKTSGIMYLTCLYYSTCFCIWTAGNFTKIFLIIFTVSLIQLRNFMANFGFL